jgi:hypothetical protein
MAVAGVDGNVKEIFAADSQLVVLFVVAISESFYW